MRYSEIYEQIKDVDEFPDVFYHGTNFIAATEILNDGEISANYPVDEDDLGAVVSMTGDADVAKSFAIEFLRVNSDFDVGVIFKFNAKPIIDKFEVFPYDAETASFDEDEFRVQGDVSLEFMTDLKIVGDVDRLYDEEFLENSFDENRHMISGGFPQFRERISKLLELNS